jgi:hypothetical protein
MSAQRLAKIERGSESGWVINSCGGMSLFGSSFLLRSVQITVFKNRRGKNNSTSALVIAEICGCVQRTKILADLLLSRIWPSRTISCPLLMSMKALFLWIRLAL